MRAGTGSGHGGRVFGAVHAPDIWIAPTGPTRCGRGREARRRWRRGWKRPGTACLPCCSTWRGGRPDRPMLRFWRDGGWRAVSWADFARRTAAVAAGLRAAGVSPGDRVLLVSESRPEFNIADAGVDGGRRRDRADLQHQPARRPRPCPARFGRPRSDRLHPRPGRQGAGRRRRGGRARPAGLHGRRARRSAAPGHAPPRLGRAGRRAGRPAHAHGRVRADPRRPPRLPDLHLRHRRLAERGDAAAPRHAGEPRRPRHGAGAPVARRHALPFLPAAVPLLRAHRRLLPAALARHGGGVFARRRAPRRRDGGGTPHHPHRCPAPVRGAAGADAGAGREGWRPQAAPLRARPRLRPSQARRPAARPARTRAGRRAGPAGARQGPRPLRRPAGRHGLRRRPARSRPVRLLPGARPAGAPGLRPERGGPRHQRQPALEQRPPHGRRAAARASRRASPRTAKSSSAATW